MADARKRMREAGSITPDIDVPWGTIGMALDYRLRYYFSKTPSEDLVAYKLNFNIEYSEDLGAYHRTLNPESEYLEFFTDLDILLEENPPSGVRLSQTHEDLLNKYCIVLSLLDEKARGFRQNPLLEGMPDAKSLLDIVENHWIDDLRELSWNFYDNHHHLLSLPHVQNPTFTESSLVGGADADLIIDRMLIDIKTTKNLIGALELRQLLGYLLLDSDDQYGIESIGFYLARQGIFVAWPIEEVIRNLCSEPTTSIEELREQFKMVLVYTSSTDEGFEFMCLDLGHPNEFEGNANANHSV